MTGIKYIYDIKFANRLISLGCRALGVGFNHNTRSPYVKFDYYELQEKFYDTELNIKRGSKID